MKKNAVVNQYELPVEIKREGNYYIATSPVWSDCYAQGHSLEGVVDQISSVARTLIEVYEEEGLKIPLKLKRENKSVKNYKFDLSILSPAF